MKKTICAMFVMLLLVLTSCQTNLPNLPSEQGNFKSTFSADKDIDTLRFKSVGELNEFLKEHESSGGMYSSRGVMIESAVMTDSVQMEKSAPPPSYDNLDYSGTNVQVQGIDEADILKTDGNYIYTITDKTLFVIKAYPGEDADVVAKIKFEDRPQGLFVEGNKMAVFGHAETLDYSKWDFVPTSGMSFFNIYDIRNKKDIELEKEFKFEGSYFNGRMNNGIAYIVVNSYPQYRIMPMPLIMENGEKSNIAIEDMRYFDIPYDSAQFTSVYSIDLVNEELVDSKSFAVEATQSMYMSDDNLYIVSTKYVNEWDFEQEIRVAIIEQKLPESEKKRIEKIRNADSELLSRYEKQSKISEIVNRYIGYLKREERDSIIEEVNKRLKEKLKEFKYFEYTVINKVSVDDGEIEAVANGKVPGHIVNQFSMDEYDNVFRIATTVNQRWDRFIDEEEIVESKRLAKEGVIADRMFVPMPPQRMSESTNNVYTLDEDLDIMDSIEGLAEGEQIFSTRFMGDRLYMVTFRQVDPFFVIDLSNPSNIRELGKLKIPGFSRYLHPYDKNIVIGLGRDTDEGRQTGIKISLFDVSDVENPKEIAKWVGKEEYAQTTAEFEHKAFLFSKEKNLLIIPAYNYDYEGREGYNGALVFDISEDGISLRGLIDHSAGHYKGYYYGQGVERSLYIEDLLYTKSSTLLRINEIDDLNSVKDVELKINYEGDMVIIEKWE